MTEVRIDAEFVADMRSAVDSRPLSEPGAVSLSGDEAARLVRLAEEALRSRAKLAAGPVVGPRGYLAKLDAQDGRGRMTALVEFSDEDELRRAAAWIAAEIVIEPAPPALEAANESTPGQGSPATEGNP